MATGLFLRWRKPFSFRLAVYAIHYVNAHATGTPLGDKAEPSRWSESRGSDDLYARVEHESLTGHPCGAAGGLRLFFAH